VLAGDLPGRTVFIPSAPLTQPPAPSRQRHVKTRPRSFRVLPPERDHPLYPTVQDRDSRTIRSRRLLRLLGNPDRRTTTPHGSTADPQITQLPRNSDRPPLSFVRNLSLVRTLNQSRSDRLDQIAHMAVATGSGQATTERGDHRGLAPGRHQDEPKLGFPGP
jgi:hypothetical protein